MLLPSLRAALAVAVWSLAIPAAAQAPSPPGATDKLELTVEELLEREARKACKVVICAAFHNRSPGGDIACNVLKSWRKEQLGKMIEKAKPYGWIDEAKDAIKAHVKWSG